MNDGNDAIIEAHIRHLNQLEIQRASFGLYVPPYIEMEKERITAELDRLQQQRVQLIFRAKHLALEPPPLAQGLILLISPLRTGEALASLATYQAIEYHRGTLHRCWFIATEDADPTAQALQRHFAPYRVTSTIHSISNGGDMSDTRALVTSLYAEIAQEGILSRDEVIIDITGGTKPMAAGAVLASGAGQRMQYMLYQEKGLPSLPVLLHM